MSLHASSVLRDELGSNAIVEQLGSSRSSETLAAMRHSLVLAVVWLAAPCQGWVTPPPQLCSKAAAAPPRRGRRRTPELRSNDNEDDLPEETIGDAWEAGLENGRAIGKTVVARFASPRVDDQGLIIADALARRPVWKSNFGCPTHRRDVVPVAASARWYNNTHRSRASSRRGSKSSRARRSGFRCRAGLVCSELGDWSPRLY